MKIQQKFDNKWENIVDRVYIQNEDFDYKKTKKIVKDINLFAQELKRVEKEVQTTLSLTDFNEQEELKKELENFLEYAKNQDEYLANFINLEPLTKQGFYNYIKNMIGFL